MSAVFATPKDTEAARLGMLPSLLGGRPGGKLPPGIEQVDKDPKSGKVQPQVMSSASPDAPPGLPPTPKGEAIRRAIQEAVDKEAAEKAAPIVDDVEHLAEKTSDEESTSGDDELTDEEGTEVRPAMESLEKTAEGLPSVGSALHASGQCSRCCFFLKNRCRNGVDCQFCHLEHERRSRGRGCRGRGTQSKEAKAQAQAAALAEAQQQPPAPQSHGAQEPRPTLLTAPPGLGGCQAPPGLAPPEAIKPVNMLSTSHQGRAPPPPAAPRLSGLPAGMPPSAPPPFAAPNGLPEERGEALPPPPANSPGSYAEPPLRSPSAVKPAPGLTLNEEVQSQTVASQMLLSTSAPRRPPHLTSLEGCTFASPEGNVTWGQGQPLQAVSAANSFRPTAGPVTVATTPTAAAPAIATPVSAAMGQTGTILGTTPMGGAAMMPMIPGVPRHLCMQPGMLQQPIMMPPQTPIGARPPTPMNGLSLTAAPTSAHPSSNPATPAAWTGIRRNMAASLAAAAEAADDSFNQTEEKPAKISVPEIDGEAALLDPLLPAKKRLPEWAF